MPPISSKSRGPWTRSAISPPPGSSSICGSDVGSGRAAVAQAIDLALQAIEELACPEEFAGQDRQRSKNCQPARARQGNHGDARRQQEKTAGDLAVSEEATHFCVDAEEVAVVPA